MNLQILYVKIIYILVKTMRINNIVLYNIGPFVGKNKFIFKTTNDKNIILIGGENGSGKTTIFSALKLGLFGSYSMGLTTNTDKYFETVKEILNNKVQSKKISNFYVSISYNEISGLEERVVEIKREWKKNIDKFSEFVTIIVNGERLSKSDEITHVNKLKSNISPALLSSLMFDGEKVASLVEDDRINEYLKDLINNSFNLNLFDKMNQDIEAYISKEIENSNLSQEEISLLEKRSEYKNSNLQLKSLLTELSEWQTFYKDQQIFQNKKIEEFRVLGGLNELEISIYKEKLHGLEIARKEKSNKVKVYLENYYTFSINEDLLKSAKSKIINEIPETIHKLVSYLEDNSDSYYNSDELFKIKELLGNLSKEPVVHNTESSIIEKINLILYEINNGNSIKTIKNNFNSMKRNKGNLSVLKKKLNTDTDNELRAFNLEIVKINKVLYRTKEKISTKENEIKQLHFIIESKELELHKIEREVFNFTKEKNSFKIANRIMDLNNEFISKKIENLISKLEKIVLIKFNEIIRKKDYVKRIEINRETYSLKLIRNKNEILTFKNLSAGEKQILIACIVVSIYELSRKSLPFIFDTPLARLDTLNRVTFVNKIIKNAGFQVIVLSTDEEIYGENLVSLEQRINHKYLLVNDGEEKTQVKYNNYFGGDNNVK